MKKLIEKINNINKYGLESNISQKAIDLEYHLIQIYNSFFDYDYNFDETEYDKFDNSNYQNIQENIKSNFPEFGFYNIVLNPKDNISGAEIVLGDAIDDLNDIIIDLLEVKWRLENNSFDDGIWYFKFIFENHTKFHILGLLNYLHKN